MNVNARLTELAVCSFVTADTDTPEDRVGMCECGIALKYCTSAAILAGIIVLAAH